MLLATVLALTSAALHAGWNLVAKRSADRFLALWGQFAVAAVIAAVALAATRTLPAAGYAWGAASGMVHLPYLLALAHAYEHGDFSVAYPIARGGGALLAGLGGIVLLGDDLGPVSVAAIFTVAAGMVVLAAGASAAQVGPALLVALTIGAYTTIDSQAARQVDDLTYVFATFLATGTAMTIYGIATGRRADMASALRIDNRQYVVTAVMSIVTYGLVLVAVRRAPVGYVAALRESSVLAATFIGWRYLDEGQVRRRTIGAAVIVGGLVLLVASA